MAKVIIELTDEQKRKNALILERLEADRNRLFEETRALQQQWKSKISRRRSKHSLNREVLLKEQEQEMEIIL